MVDALAKHLNKPPQRAVEPSEPGWRTLGCIVAALLTAGLGFPFLKTAAVQVAIMRPPGLNEAAYRGLVGHLRSSPEVITAWRALANVAQGRDAAADLAAMRRVDPDNSLPDYLELLTLLRRQSAAATGPSGEWGSAIDALLARTGSGPPVRVPVARERELAEAFFLQAGWDPRRAAAEADRVAEAGIGVRSWCRSILRELVNRLEVLAGDYQAAGRSDQAVLAHQAAVRLLTDVVSQSPTPDLALLAAEKLPSALRALGATREATGVEAFRKRWHQVGQSDRVNLLPWTGDFALVPDTHDAVLRSLCGVGLAEGVWLTLAMIVMILLFTVGVTGSASRRSVGWRWGGRGLVLAPWVVCAPLAAGLGLLALADPPFTWLTSLPSLGGVVFLPAVIAVLVIAATRVGLAPAKSLAPGRVPAWGVGLLAVLVLGTMLTAAMRWPIHVEPWRPPVAIQRFRKLGLTVGLVCTAMVPVLLAWGLVQRRRAGLPAGLWARPTLALAARAWLLVSLIALAALAVNHHLDRRHCQAFVAAASDPIASRLGPDWLRTYFAPARGACP